MPQKNTLKEYVPNSYYHVYFRGVNKQKLFLDAADYKYLLGLLRRYLSPEKVASSTGVLYPNYRGQIELLCYCLMTNHVHLLVYQLEDAEVLRRLMSSLLTSYSKYFNLKYRRVGSVFESRYKAKRIDNDSYLMHVSRYIHMNPRRWQSYRHSSLRFMLGESPPSWLEPDRVTDEFQSKQDYIDFLQEYQNNKDELEGIKHQLADV